MIRPFERQPAWIVWIGSATLSSVLTLVVYLWIVVPVYQQQNAQAALLASVQEKQAEAVKLESQLRDYSAKLFHQQAAMAHQPVELGNRRELNRRIAALIESAQSLGLEVLQVQPGTVTPNEHFDLVELRLEAVGTFAQHLSILDALHKEYPDVSVIDLSLSSEVRSANPRPTLNLKLAWFTRVDDPQRSLTSDAVEASAADR
jgi:Tfp pilus assembly protein PilO